MDNQAPDDMEFGTAFEGGDGEKPTFATGVYVVTCESVIDAGPSRFPLKDKDGEPKRDDDGNPIFPQQWKWIFRIDEVDSRRATEAQLACVGETIHRWTNKTLGRGPSGPSNTRAYIGALIGRDIEDGERPKLGWVIGRQAIATMTVKDGKVSEFGLMPYGDSAPPAASDEPLGSTTKAATYPDDRERIMNDLLAVDDRRDLAAIRSRIQALRLDHDDEVNDIYRLTHSRLVDGASAPPSVRQQALTN